VILKLRKSEDTKNRIIQSAIKLISQNGYAATTTAQIAKDAGISEATLFKYFKDKENLLHKVVSVALTQILDSVALSPLKENIKKNRDLKASEFLRSIINERLEMLDRNIDLFKIILIEINYNDSLKNEVIKNMVPKTCEAKGLIEWILIRKGNISKEMAKGISRMMIGTLLTFLFQKYILGIETTSDEIEEEIENVLNVIKKSIGEE